MDIWRDCPTKPLPEVLTTIIDNRGKTVPVVDSGFPLIATNCIHNELLYPTYEKIRFINDETYTSWFRGHPIPGDVIFVCKGTPGKVCLVPEPVDFAIAQDMVSLRANPEIIYNKFLLAVLRSDQIQRFIYNRSVGDVIPHFKKSFFELLEIPIPPMQLQKKIGDFYFEISSKIETNRRINARLEELAQAIFKSWFIDFEPFGGQMPQDWELKSLSEIANYLNGLAMQKYPPINNNDKIPVLKIRELGEGRITDNSDFCSKANIGSDYIIENGDIIFSWSGTLLVKMWTGVKCGLNQHLFKVTSSQYPKWFYYFWTLYHNENFKRIAKDKAVTMGHIKRDELDKAKVFVPTADVMLKIDSILSPLLEQNLILNLESTRLAELRDTLLPKLMSGEVKPE